MKGKVKFPFSVKYKGQYYAPNAEIEVDDVAEQVKQGAQEIKAPKKDAPKEQGKK